MTDRITVLSLVEREDPDWRELYDTVTEAAVDLGILPPPRSAATGVKRPKHLDFHNEWENWRRAEEWEEDMQEYD